MALVALTLDPNARARALLHYILEQGDVIGAGSAGTIIIQLGVDDWAFGQLLQFDRASEDASPTSVVDSKNEHVGQNCGAMWRQTGSRMVGGDR